MSLSAEEQSILADYYKGKAFPQPLSRRDHFAMAAMTGFLSRNNPVPDVKNDGDVPEFIAKASVILADALIAELDGGEG